MLEVCNVTKIYREFLKENVACKNVSFEVKEGEIVSLLGLNGAGKSTIIKIIAGLVKPSEGDVLIEGCSVVKNPILAKREIGVLFENAPLYNDLTVEEFLMFSMQMRGILKREARKLLAEALDADDLNGIQSKKIATLSKGYKQRVASASIFACRPRVFILDEPTSNLDSVQLKNFGKHILQLDKSRIVLISTHNLEFAQEICTKHILLKNGEVILQGSIEELREAIQEKLQDGSEINRDKVLELAFDIFGGVKKSDFFKG